MFYRHFVEHKIHHSFTIKRSFGELVVSKLDNLRLDIEYLQRKFILGLN